jgi:hypothetical protein
VSNQSKEQKQATSLKKTKQQQQWNSRKKNTKK